MTIHYNEMLMMLWNVEESAALFADFDQWSENETNAINNILKNNKNLLLIQKDSNKFTHTISHKGMKIKAENNKSEMVFWHSFNKQYDYEKMKRDLNIKNIFVFNNNIDLEKIKLSFEQIEILKFDEKLISSNKLSIEALKNGQMEKYYEINGFNYGFNGFVEQGNQLGRTIGYPTANVIVNNELKIKPGVYVSKIKLPNIDKLFEGISVYWTNPNGVSVFETHILDFDQDIYGWSIEIEIVHFIRESIKVERFEQVKELLNNDKAYAIKYFKEQNNE